MTIYFTSDSHFFHKNVLEFEDRPYDTLEEMNQGLIDAWNDVVKPGDIVKHLGDFCFGGYDKWVEIISQLNGEIHLSKGNHCKSRVIKKLYKEGYLKELHMMGDYMRAGGYVLNLTHYPLEIGHRRKQYSVHGHIHSKPSRMHNQINIGVDSLLNFNRPFGQPISLDELIVYLDHIDPNTEELFHKERN